MKVRDINIEENKNLSIWEALIPVVVLIALLAYNVSVHQKFELDALDGTNQFILILGAAVAAIVGFRNKVSYKTMLREVGENLKSTSSAILILLMVGALAGTWLVSGIIPAMIYYGLQILNPTIFLAASLIISAIISMATGSSWTTSATVGIALIGIGKALGIPIGMTAGAVLSGAYFGDKMSPLSDTTNLAPAMAGTDLFTHIRYMMYTTIPTISITLLVFIIIGLTTKSSGTADVEQILMDIKKSFNITPWLFLVPLAVIAMIIRKTPPLIALLIGTILAAVFALVFQQNVLEQLAGVENLNFNTTYLSIMQAITVDSAVSTENQSLVDLFQAGGMKGMLGTIFLIICAMVFGGVMDAIGALARISEFMLSLFSSVFGLFASTVITCLGLNITASDQYLALVVAGKMYKQAYEDKGLAPENLSRTLEDSGTVTSVLIPWNTCGAYHSATLQVGVGQYFAYAIFAWLSPFMTLLVAALGLKIRQLQRGV